MEPPAAGPDGTSEEAPRQTVLLVEDSETDRDVYGGLLWYNGFDVLHVPDGESAIARALEARPDLVLLDIRLAGALSGLDVAKRLREVGFDAPMIVLSALSREEAGAAVDGVGISAYLEKPIDPFTVVREVIRRIGHAPHSGGG